MMLSMLRFIKFPMWIREPTRVKSGGRKNNIVVPVIRLSYIYKIKSRDYNLRYKVKSIFTNQEFDFPALISE